MKKTTTSSRYTKVPKKSSYLITYKIKIGVIYRQGGQSGGNLPNRFSLPWSLSL
jgi:hypothetical protein